MTLHQTVEAANVRRGQYSFSESLVTLSDPFAQSAEYIRALRTHIMAQHVEAGRRALAICEASPKLGATFVAANLAVSLAQAGVKTLLVDGNLREPTIQHMIIPDRELPGLRECLSVAGSSVGDFVQGDILPNLSVLYSGGAAPNAQELLARSSFEQVINSCLRDYEMTIIDTPPANSCADARRISTVVGYSIVVAKRNVSYVGEVASLAAQLEEDGARVVGTVLNEV